MKKKLKKYLVPHDDNNHKPHLFDEKGVVFFLLVVALFFSLSGVHRTLLHSDSFLAAILPAVLTEETNEVRAEERLSTLTWSDELARAAEMKARHMAEEGYFAHYSPDGVSPWHWLVEAGYQFTYAGENLAVNFFESSDVTNAWLASPGHRANILNTQFTEIGIATAEGEYKGKKTTFVVQMFGTPRVERTEVAETPTAPVSGDVLGQEREDTDTSNESQPDSTSIGAGTESASQQADTIEPEESETVEYTVVAEEETFVAVNPVEESNDQAPDQSSGGAEVVTEVQETSEPNEASREVASTSFDESGEEATSTETEVVALPATVGGGGASGWIARTLGEVAADPGTLYQIIYLLLGILVAFALLLMLVHESHKKHPLPALHGALMLVLVGTLLFLNNALMFASNVEVI